MDKLAEDFYVESDEPFNHYHEIQKHPRYISEFKDEVIIIDISLNINESRTSEIDLGIAKISSYEGINPLKRVFNLNEFDGFKEAIKLSLNQFLFKSQNNGNQLHKNIVCFYNNLLRFYTWLAQQGIYQLSQVSQKTMHEFLLGIKCKGGWIGILSTEGSFKRLLASGELKKAVRINGKNLSLNLADINLMIGYPIHYQWVHKDIYVELFKEFGINKDVTQTYSNLNLSDRTIRGILENINLLSYLPDSFDRLQFIPFPSPSQLAKTSTVVDNRTKNIPIEDAVKLLKVSLEWIYGYAPILIDLYRKLINEERMLKNNETLSQQSISKLLRIFYSNEIDEIKVNSKYNFDFLSGSIKVNSSSSSFNQCIWTLMTACAVIVSINHGRRKNEVLGQYDLPFGLYVGCVEKASNLIDDVYKINIYIEKTYKDWKVFPANRLVYDVVKVLEEIDSICPEGKTILENKGRKLFQYRPPTSNRENPKTYSYEWKFINKPLFMQAGINNIDHKYHPFRRLFGLLFMYRYEHPDIRALSQQYSHLDVSMTMIYVTDPVNREEGNRIERMYLLEKQNVDDSLEEIKAEYFEEAALRILEGSVTGSGFTKHLLRVYRVLQKRVDFTIDIHEQVKSLHNLFKQKGYSPEPFPHGTCFAGNPVGGRRRAKCFEENKLNKEKASLHFCNGCTYRHTTENHLNYYKEELALAKLTVDNQNYPKTMRRAAQEQFDILVKIIDLEKSMKEKNNTYFQAIHFEKEESKGVH